jgi:NADH:ubiquinone oxidoreductase subunit 3 (subunit A)
MMSEYLNIISFIFLSFLVAVILFMVSYFLVVKQYDIEKISSYECGFDPFDEDTRGKFDVRFYLVSILFIVFDIEVTYLFPWAVCLSYLDFFGFLVMVIFLFILTLGFVYEWKKGALDW